jgi:PAS domain-containing protein
MKPNLDSTQLMQRPLWQNPRIHLLDDIWLLTIVAILIAAGVPWFVNGFEAEIGTATWGLLALGGIHIAFTVLASPRPSHGRWRDRALTLLDIIGVVLIGFIWEHVGALQNPMFLTIFALPVIGAIFLSRWHPYLIASVSVVVVAIVALSRAPELRWVASGLFGADTWLSALFGRQVAAAPAAFSGFYAPSSYLLVLLEVFTIAIFACAVAAEYLGTIFERLTAQSLLARSEAERGQELWASLIERLPVPALLIETDTLQVVAASELTIKYLGCEAVSPEGNGLFEVVRFSYPDVINELIVGPVSMSPVTAIRVADQLRLTQLRVLHLAHKGRRLSLLTFEDATEVYCLKAALDTSEYAAVVVDARGRVLAFNKLIVGLFGGAATGADVAQWLPQADPGLRWWEPGLTGRRKLHIEIGSRIYQVTSSAIALTGEEERIFSVAFLPLAKGGTVSPNDPNPTMVTSTLRQLR